MDETLARREANIEDITRTLSARSLTYRRCRRYLAGLRIIWIRVADVARRLIDLTVSGALLLLCAPLLLILHLRNRSTGGIILRTPKLGRWGCEFNQYSFSSGALAGLPVLINIWRGDMSIVGPRALGPRETNAHDRLLWKRFDIRPGLVCLWWIRVRANIAYGSEATADSDYVETRSGMSDLGLALRAVPVSIFGGGGAVAPSVVHLMGIPINNLTMEEAIEKILERGRGPAPSQVCFVNADCANIAWKDKAYSKILTTCGLVLADGIGVRLAGKLLNRNIRQNVNGTDMFPELCKGFERADLGVYLLGGKPGVAADVANWIKKTFPGLRISGYRHGYFTPPEIPVVLRQIRESGANLLLVAFGVPLQEKWINEHLAETGASVCIGVGGLFDFYSDRVKRAPVWMREIGMEWFYRFWQEPRRMWRRYFVGNVLFLARVMRSRSRDPRSV